MPDQNDIVFDQYQIDIIALIRTLFEAGTGVGVPVNGLLALAGTAWLSFTILAYLFAALCLFGIIYAYLRFNELSEIEAAGIINQEQLYQEIYRGGPTNTRWRDIEDHIASDSPNNWKIAIIEADIMLGELLEREGYAGVTIGDKLKSASPTQFTTLEDAWKAHRVRNQIAHEGADFVLTKKLANETITQYRRVFAEFGVI